MPSSSNKIALFIDGANLHGTAKTLGFDIDYRRLLKEFESRGTLVRAIYYTTIIEDQESLIRPLIDWLDYNGYTVVSKPAKEFDDREGRRRFKRSMGVELAVDALESVRRLQAGLHSFLSMRRIEARRKNASAFRLRFSQSLASLRQRLSQAMVRSTIHLRGRTSKPCAVSERLTISMLRCGRTFPSAFANFGP
jgi:hypothetical protein